MTGKKIKKFPEEGKLLTVDLLYARYNAATDHVWATDPTSKRIQRQLMQGPETGMRG